MPQRDRFGAAGDGGHHMPHFQCLFYHMLPDSTCRSKNDDSHGLSSFVSLILSVVLSAMLSVISPVSFASLMANFPFSQRNLSGLPIARISVITPSAPFTASTTSTLLSSRKIAAGSPL